MAILNIGSTYRTSFKGFSLQNTTNQMINLGVFGCNIPGLSTKSFSIDEFDNYTRNPRHPQVYEVKLTASGLGIYIDDFTVLCGLILSGALFFHSATYLASSNTFSSNATAAYTAAGTSIFIT